MSERTWHSGPPPHIGWWNASNRQDPTAWRWWDGSCWSLACRPDVSIEGVKFLSKRKARLHDPTIQWTDYYPENARVPRTDPRK